MGNIVMFCGRMGSGKDSFGKVLEDFLSTMVDVKRVAFGDSLKEELESIGNDIIVKRLNNQTLSKKYNSNIEDIEVLRKEIKKLYYKYKKFDPYFKSKEVRNLLQYWGEKRRKQDKNYWVSKTTNLIKKLTSDNIFVYITDGRYLNEIESVKSLGGKIIKLKVSRKEQLKRLEKRDNYIPTEKTLNHISEKDFERFKAYDFIINTDDLELSDIQEIVKNKILETPQLLKFNNRTKNIYLNHKYRVVPKCNAQESGNYFKVNINGEIFRYQNHESVGLSENDKAIILNLLKKG